MTCGHRTSDGSPCQQPAGWGTDHDDGPCTYHVDDDEGGRRGRSDRIRRARVDAGGRPYGELQITRILEALRDGATYKIACQRAGVSTRTFRRWREQYPDLHERVDRAEAEGAGELLDTVQTAAETGDWHAAKWLLARRFGYGKEQGLDPETADAFVSTVKGVIRDILPDDKATEVIIAIGDALEELTDG